MRAPPGTPFPSLVASSPPTVVPERYSLTPICQLYSALFPLSRGSTNTSCYISSCQTPALALCPARCPPNLSFSRPDYSGVSRGAGGVAPESVAKTLSYSGVTGKSRTDWLQRPREMCRRQLVALVSWYLLYPLSLLRLLLSANLLLSCVFPHPTLHSYPLTSAPASTGTERTDIGLGITAVSVP
jgi:hypothetical protein